MNDHRFVIIITGPTGVGKSDFAEQMAAHIPAEIINADMGQMYVPLTIGTAKPDWKKSHIQHHLFDILDNPVSYSVAQYRKAVIDIVQQLWNKKKVPIIVGGSGYYLKALFFPPHANTSSQLNATQLPHATWEALFTIDPERARKIHPNDCYRIQRALDIWHATQQKPSLYKPTYQPLFPYIMYVVTRDRSQLYERINQRVEIMIQQGWIQEVERLTGTEWEDFLRHKKIIGYDDIIDFLKKHHIDQKKLIEMIAQKTRNYAKRQLTFFRMLEKNLIESAQDKEDHFSKIINLNLTFLNLDLYIKQLLEKYDYIK